MRSKNRPGTLSKQRAGKKNVSKSQYTEVTCSKIVNSHIRIYPANYWPTVWHGQLAECINENRLIKKR